MFAVAGSVWPFFVVSDAVAMGNMKTLPCGQTVHLRAGAQQRPHATFVRWSASPPVLARIGSLFLDDGEGYRKIWSQCSTFPSCLTLGLFTSHSA